MALIKEGSWLDTKIDTVKDKYNKWQKDLKGEENNPLSYANIVKMRNQYRKSGTKSGGDFNLFDTPTTKYFKILFYFNNGDSESKVSPFSGGLLAPTWLTEINQNQLYTHNSAWSYLKLNDEQERAELLVDFVNLLSNINSESPWYFEEISGLDTALERKTITDQEFKIESERKKISIKCRPDSYDDRIATLLDLYRSITYSWSMKREVIPSNLRKFDMGIYIFSDPVFPMHNAASQRLGITLKNNYASIDNSSSNYVTSYKYIEFHNCEIDYNSGRTGLSSLKNSEGVSPEYTIDIYFDDCYENRYNEFLGRSLGDMIALDTHIAINEEGTKPYEYKSSSSNTNLTSDKNNSGDDQKKLSDKLSDAWDSVKDHYKQKQYNDLESRVNYYESTWWQNALNEVEGVVSGMGTGLIEKVMLGNLYKFSLTKLADQTKKAVNGHVFSTARAINEYVNDTKNPGKTKHVNKIGNIFQANTLANNT